MPINGSRNLASASLDRFFVSRLAVEATCLEMVVALGGTGDLQRDDSDECFDTDNASIVGSWTNAGANGSKTGRGSCSSDAGTADDLTDVAGVANAADVGEVVGGGSKCWSWWWLFCAG
jgi:hypothetical protein